MKATRCQVYIPKILFLFLLTGIILLAWQLQSSLFLNYDVSWLMHAARRLLSGGTYSRDFFETNPPLILYLYLPPVLFSKLTGLHTALLFCGYLFLLALFSLCLCSFFLKCIIPREQTTLALVFTLTLAIVFFILPCFDFGQREHVTVILTLPYFLLFVSRLQGQKVHPLFAFSLGVLAGLGFSIKPHFLLIPFLFEAYYAFSKKSALAWLRPEVVAVLAVVFLYLTSIFLFFPDYLYIVLPYSLRLYYRAVSQPWSALLLNGVALYCLFPLFFYLLQRKSKAERSLSTVFALGLLGFLIAYFAQRMTHFYHLIPALSLALLLGVVEFASLTLDLPRRRLERFLAVILGLLLLSIPVWIYCVLYTNSQDYKKETLGRLTTFLNAHAKEEAVSFFVTAGSYAFPTLDYTTSQATPRFYFLWMAAGLANQALEKDANREQGLRDKNFLINMVSDDLYQYKPRYVFVDLSENKYRIRDKNFDYLLYFSENPKFRQEWRHYHYYTTLEEKGRYKLGVYQRSSAL